MNKGPKKRSLMAREFSRREMLGFMGSAAAAAALAGCGASGKSGAGATTSGGATTAAAGGSALETTAAETTAAAATVPSCVLTPEATEGPYFLDGDKVRADITEDRPGVPVWLRTTVVDTFECVPLANAAVDIWHCDAVGDYSGFTGAEGDGGAPAGGAGQYGPPPPPGGAPPSEAGGPEAGNMAQQPTDDLTFLRGIQRTDENGVAEFDTIYPGWYQGRALHIHLKVMVGGAVSGEMYEGGHVAHTGQLFFPEDVTDQVALLEPYVQHSSVAIVPHAQDSIFQQSGAENAIVALTPLVEGGSVEDGFVAEIVVGVDPSATPDPAGMGAEGGPDGGS